MANTFWSAGVTQFTAANMNKGFWGDGQQNAEHLIFENAFLVKGRDVADAVTHNLIGIDSNDIIQIGNTTLALTITAGDDVIVNQNSVDVITSVDSGAVVNTLYLTAGKVGIINTAPGDLNAAADDLVIGDGTAVDRGITILSNTANVGSLYFAKDTTTGEAVGRVTYTHAAGRMDLITEGVAGIQISAAQVVTIPQLTASQDVQTDGSKALTSVSDMEWKNDRGPILGATKIVMGFQAHYFDWLRDSNGTILDTLPQPRLAGLFSQEVYAVFPEGSPGGPNTDKNGVDHWGLNSRAILAVMIASQQEIVGRIEALEA